jgi:hypothetical protein
MPDLFERIKRIEFNKTEPEVLIELIKDANQKGEKVQKESKRLKNRAKEVFKKLSIFEEILIKEDKLPSDYNPLIECTIGIDGSYNKVGGVGGKWYSPYSIVRIRFENGITSMPIVDIYSAGIEEIEEQETPNVDEEASLRMLEGETKAINNWGSKNISSIVFIDGPIVDPPTYKDKDYIDYRCKAIKKCLKHSLVIGCVKRSRDIFFIKDFEKILGSSNGELRKDFLGDQQIFAYFFTNFRFENDYRGVLFSKYIDISDHDTCQMYKENGLHVYSTFYQKNINSKILRIDIAIPEESLSNAQDLILKGIKASADWQYPKQDIPLPIELAHEKCKIRKGAADILYEEIITKSRSTSIDDQIVMLQLR